MIYLQIKKKIQEGKKNIKNVFEVQVINYFTTHHFSLLVMKTTNETGKKKRKKVTWEMTQGGEKSFKQEK